MCLKLWFESNWHFCNITESGWFFKSTTQKQSSKLSLPRVYFKKVTVQKPTVELWTVISNQMITYQLPHTWFDQIIDHKLDIYLQKQPSKGVLRKRCSKLFQLYWNNTSAWKKNTSEGLILYLYGKLSTKLIAQAINKNINFMLTKTGQFFSEVTVRKNSKQILSKCELKKLLSRR